MTRAVSTAPITAVHAVLDAGMDLRKVQRPIRHRDLRTLTRCDDHRSDLAGDVAAVVAGLVMRARMWAALLGFACAACSRAKGPIEFVSTDGSQRIQARVDTAANRVMLRFRYYDKDSLVSTDIRSYGGQDSLSTCQVFSASAWTCRNNPSLSVLVNVAWTGDGELLRAMAWTSDHPAGHEDRYTQRAKP